METSSKKEQTKMETVTPTDPTPAPVSVTPTTSSPSHGGGLAIAAMVIGIVAIILGWVPFLGFALGVTAVVLGIIGLKHKINKGMSIAGLVTGAVAVVWGLIVSILALIALLGFAAITSTATNVLKETNDSLSQYNIEQQAKIDAKKDFAKGTTAIFDKFEVKANSVQRNYVPEDTYSQAGDGKELIVVNVSVKNTSTNPEDFSSYDLGLNDKGVTNTSSYLSVDPEFTGGNMSKDATTTGNIVYEIDKGSTDLKLQYEQTVYSASEGTKTLTYTLAL